mgnify:CR=1 FL=1
MCVRGKRERGLYRRVRRWPWVFGVAAVALTVYVAVVHRAPAAYPWVQFALYGVVGGRSRIHISEPTRPD